MIKRNEFFQKVSKAVDAVIDFGTNNRVWVFGLLLWTISIIFATESHERSWFIFTPVFGLLSLVYLPTLLFAFFRNRLKSLLSKPLFYILSLLIFVAYPLSLTLTNLYKIINRTNVFEFHEAVHHNEEVLFHVLFYIGVAFFLLEIGMNLRSNWKFEIKLFQRIKKITLEQTLIILISCLSGLLSIIELTTNGHGINGFTDIPIYFGKWLVIGIQFFIIMFTYYLFYWVNHYILINKVLKPKGIIPYAFSFMFVVLIGYPIAAQIAWWVTSIDFFGMPRIIDQGPFDGVFFAFPFIEMLVSIPFILAIQWSKQSNEIATLEKEKSNAELNLLKQQINPHFFFNTLNNLYALSLKKDEATPEVILQLSELMRYVIYKGREETVLLKEEVKYIEDYCELQQIRLYKDIDFKFTKNIENETIQIPPLLFIILVENAFKHGIEPAEDICFLHLELESDENSLVFICENSYEENPEKIVGGIGLENLKQRLDLRFPNQYQLNISEMETTYKVELRITRSSLQTVSF